MYYPIPLVTCPFRQDEANVIFCRTVSCMVLNGVGYAAVVRVITTSRRVYVWVRLKKSQRVCS